jgi:protein involved in polysaccharide export with SLBB domain
LTNPVASGVPASRVPPELLGKPKDGEETIPLAMLGQPTPETYRLAPGDILGVWIEGVLGDRTIPLPVHITQLVQTRDQRRIPPSVGYPILVEEDGTVMLPLVGAVKVQDLTLPQAAEAVRKAYTDKQILPAGRERVLVTLLQPRQVQVVVIRQDSAAFPGAETAVGTPKRGTGNVLGLPAYENDVLHALAETGGLPGLDAINAVYIFRGYGKGIANPAALLQQLDAARGAGTRPVDADANRIVCIPLRVRPGEPPPFRPEDVLLQTGDVVFVEALEFNVFYTGGLLPSGQFVLPRDKDLDVLEAVTRVRGPLINGGVATNNLAGNLIAPGFGGPSPSLLTVLRRRPEGGRLPIIVDLNRAVTDAHECIRVLPGDVLILQEKPSEALARYASQTLLNFSWALQVIRSPMGTGVLDISAPERIPSRVTVTDFTNTTAR